LPVIILYTSDKSPLFLNLFQGCKVVTRTLRPF